MFLHSPFFSVIVNNIYYTQDNIQSDEDSTGFSYRTRSKYSVVISDITTDRLFDELFNIDCKMNKSIKSYIYSNRISKTNQDLPCMPFYQSLIPKHTADKRSGKG